MKSKIISGAIALAYLLTAYFVKGSIWTMRSASALVLALACIWFSESIGGYTGGLGRGRIDVPIPAFLVALAGWMLLAIVGCIAMAST